MVYWLLVFLLSTVLAKPLDSDHRWNEFKVKYNKFYTSQEEENYRYDVFIKNVKVIEEHNKKYKFGLESYRLGINRFADVDKEEFIKLTTSKLDLPFEERHVSYKTFKTAKLRDVPTSFDWRNYGAVTPVKNQRECLSCYAFTALGCLESQIYLKQNLTLDLSEQNIVDCSWSTNDHGCAGGYMDRVYKYIRDFGIMNETSYPYTGQDDKCQWNENQRVLKIQDYAWVGKSELELKEAVVAIGPIGAAVDYKELQFYENGIFDPKENFEKLTHGVLVIGYGSEGGVDYWIIKNSYGTEWGENGFGRIKMNTTFSLGLYMGAIYPILT